MANNLNKTVKIDIDTKDFEANYLNKLKEVKKLENDINSIYDKRFDNIKRISENYEKLWKADVISEKEGRKAIALEKERLQLQKELNAEEKEYLKLQKLKDAQEKEKEFQRKDWEQGKETVYQKFQKYRGIKGIGDLASDKINKSTLKANRAIDIEIASLEAEASDKDTSEERKAEIKDKISSLKDTKSKNIGASKTKINKVQTAVAIAGNAIKMFGSVAKMATKPLVDLAKGALDVAKSFLDLKTGVATYATGTSLITNKAAREQQLKYGLSSAQNFAFTQAKSMLNISDDEDLMYMNTAQREKFLEYMQRYSSWYDKMESSGVLGEIQEMQLEFQELKQELGMELLSWLAANKDTIMVCVKGIFTIIKQIAEFVMTIASWFTGGNTQNNTFNITATTTNNVSNQTMADVATHNQWSGLAKQVVTSIGG